MTRSLFLFAALAAAAPAFASTYVGQPVAAPGSAKFVTRDVIWAPAAGSYRASTTESRPLVLCQGLAKRAGALASFTVDGKAFDAAELARCNALAPRSGGSGTASAN